MPKAARTKANKAAAKATSSPRGAVSGGPNAEDPASPARGAPAEVAAPAPPGGAADLSQVLALLSALQMQGAATFERLSAVESAQTAQANAFAAEGADLRSAIDDTRAQVLSTDDNAVAIGLARAEAEAAAVLARCRGCRANRGGREARVRSGTQLSARSG